MDKQVLEQLAAVKREIKDLEERIQKTQRDIDKYKKLIVSDTVKGTRPDGTYGPIKITGLEKKNLAKRRNTLLRHREHLEAARTKEVIKVQEAELYIESVQDSDLRSILRWKCMDELTWPQIARKIRKWGEDNCRKKYDDFMKE